MREDAYATHQLCYGPFCSKESAASAAVSLHQCYAPMTDELSAA